MLCLSSGVTVAGGLKSDRITDERTLSDTSATHGENHSGWRTDYPYATALNYILYMYREALIFSHVFVPWSHRGQFSALISCSDTNL